MEKTESIRKTLGSLIKAIGKAIEKDTAEQGKKGIYALMDTVKAYNAYRDNECGTEGMIWNINDQDDVRECVLHGMDAPEIASVYQKSLSSGVPFFTYDDYAVTAFSSYEELRSTVMGQIDAVLMHVITDSHCCEAYRRLFTRYVADALYGDGDVYPGDEEILADITEDAD